MDTTRPQHLFSTLQATLHERTDSGEGGVLLSFSGQLTPEVHDSLMMLAENSLKGKGIKRKLVRRVCSTLIECLQNVSRHGWVDDEGEIRDKNVNRTKIRKTISVFLTFLWSILPNAVI